jgi:hypothetical protein
MGVEVVSGAGYASFTVMTPHSEIEYVVFFSSGPVSGINYEGSPAGQPVVVGVDAIVLDDSPNRAAMFMVNRGPSDVVLLSQAGALLALVPVDGHKTIVDPGPISIRVSQA